MKFWDTLTFWKPERDAFKETAVGNGHIVAGNVAQSGEFVRSGVYNSMAGDARCYLDGSNEWLKSIGYEIEGYYCAASLHGVQTVYRVMSKAVGRAFVTDGTSRHVEADLEKVTKKVIVPEVES